MGIITALFLVGAACGGLFFGWLGDRVLVNQTGSREEAWLSDAPGQLFHPYSDQQLIVDSTTPGQITYVSWGGKSVVKRAQ